jgi:hypothetical protein
VISIICGICYDCHVLACIVMQVFYVPNQSSLSYFGLYFKFKIYGKKKKKKNLSVGGGHFQLKILSQIHIELDSGA